MITNDLSYKNEPRGETYYERFSLHNNRRINSGEELRWVDDHWPGEKFSPSIILEGSYGLIWEEYSKIENVNNGEFFYLLNQIPRKR